ncbi:hypothetical protein PR048_012811 [Dryococelus australis]|uniref:Uncharacterized protein n=1 Tax=Dryococelus australis TaxID=614101 RepID=A0ABQ9HR76_9NEOP|nr:hypothetical protein PR048_012811 [Dryococelus australis]
MAEVQQVKVVFPDPVKFPTFSASQLKDGMSIRNVLELNYICREQQDNYTEIQYKKMYIINPYGKR